MEIRFSSASEKYQIENLNIKSLWLHIEFFLVTSPYCAAASFASFASSAAFVSSSSSLLLRYCRRIHFILYLFAHRMLYYIFMALELEMERRPVSSTFFLICLYQRHFSIFSKQIFHRSPSLSVPFLRFSTWINDANKNHRQYLFAALGALAAYEHICSTRRHDDWRKIFERNKMRVPRYVEFLCALVFCCCQELSFINKNSNGFNFSCARNGRISAGKKCNEKYSRLITTILCLLLLFCEQNSDHDEVN